MAEDYNQWNMEGCTVGEMRALFRAVELVVVSWIHGQSCSFLTGVIMLESSVLTRQCYVVKIFQQCNIGLINDSIAEHIFKFESYVKCLVFVST